MRRNDLANDLLKASTAQQLPPMLQVFAHLVIVSISGLSINIRIQLLTGSILCRVQTCAEVVANSMSVLFTTRFATLPCYRLSKAF